MEETDKNDGVLERNLKNDIEVESRQPTKSEMVCGYIICACSRNYWIIFLSTGKEH